MARNGKKLTGQPAKLNKTLASAPRLTLSFSFLYFRQIDNFGLGGEDGKWFVSLLERLKDMCSKNSGILQDLFEKRTYRLHQVNWAQNNIPLQRNDLKWLPKEYLENEEDFPIWQFAISTGRGRIIGFFNEQNTVFYIVLLDPKHNMQPSKSYGYKVDKTTMETSEIEKLQCRIATMKQADERFEQLWTVNAFDDDLEYIALEHEYAAILHAKLDTGHFMDDLQSYLLSQLE